MSKVEKLIGLGLCYSGLVSLAQLLLRRSEQKLIILCHHRASGDYLRGQLLYLKHHYRILHLEAALEELYGSSKQERRRKDRRPLLAITFDDGYQDNYTHAFALACELQIPITIFLVSSAIEDGRPFAWLAGEDEHLVPFARVSSATIEERVYQLNTAEGRQALTRAIDDRVRYPTTVASREEYLASVRQILAVPATLTEGEKRDLPLNWDQVEEMEKSEWVSIGAHTRHHPILPCLTNPLEVDEEIGGSRSALEQKLEHSVHTFSYPYGEFGEREVHAVRAAGYRWAVTTIHGFNTARTDPSRLYRIVVGEHQHWSVVAAKASGVWEWLLSPWRAVARAFKR